MINVKNLKFLKYYSRHSSWAKIVTLQSRSLAFFIKIFIIQFAVVKKLYDIFHGVLNFDLIKHNQYLYMELIWQIWIY